ncbi:MAG: Aminodeoxyfutalosine deaminase [Chloroflexi bacterium ADurb.Bin222]|nr:MAG: Aminodeoxyfutalosine deaminase [Chloroflexi bacterium ADurb.Bin222]
MMELESFITQMPKVELHVHLEGSVQPGTLLKLAERHQVPLPADTVEGLREWYTFRDFDHFIEIYMTISRCLRTAEDIELIAREFLAGQAAQNIVYSEVTFTPYNQFMNNGLGFHEQIDAVNRAREWGERALGVRMGIIMDIPRIITPAEGDTVASWMLERYGDGLIALGLGGPEIGNPPQKYRSAFDRVRAAGIPCILHAGETAGAESIWEALTVAGSRRIGHGVRAIEDPALMAHLREQQIPLEVCPSSNICLKVFPSLVEHSLPQLLEAGLYVTLNSDDPPMFNTTLTREYLLGQRTWNWNRDDIEKLMFNAVDATLLPETERQALRHRFEQDFERFSAA